MKYAMVIVVMLLAACLVANAAVPPMINYQGRLMQPSGAAVPDGTYAMHFAIYDVPTGGTALWSEPNGNVQVKGGLFAVLLGSVNNLGPNLFDSPNRFFAVKVGTDPEMTPRQQIASVGFAVKASAADTAATVSDGAITTTKLGDGAATTPKLADAVVTTAKIADGAVTAAKIANGALTAAKIETQQGWQTPPLLNGWVNYGRGYNPVGYMKDSLGFVHLKGLVEQGATMTTIFSLPVGYRPAAECLFASMSGDIIGRIDVLASGDVRQIAGTIYISLDGITFKAEQ